jgi:hypothetical protein
MGEGTNHGPKVVSRIRVDWDDRQREIIPTAAEVTGLEVLLFTVTIPIGRL